jgi:hypothetical protein
VGKDCEYLLEMVKEDIQRVHWQTFLTRLWAGNL